MLTDGSKLCASEGGSASRACAREWLRCGSKNLPFGNPAESNVRVRLPSALRPRLAPGVPFSVEFQSRRAAGYVCDAPAAGRYFSRAPRPRPRRQGGEWAKHLPQRL